MRETSEALGTRKHRARRSCFCNGTCIALQAVLQRPLLELGLPVGVAQARGGQREHDEHSGAGAGVLGARARR